MSKVDLKIIRERGWEELFSQMRGHSSEEVYSKRFPDTLKRRGCEDVQTVQMAYSEYWERCWLIDTNPDDVNYENDVAWTSDSKRMVNLPYRVSAWRDRITARELESIDRIAKDIDAMTKNQQTLQSNLGTLIQIGKFSIIIFAVIYITHFVLKR